MLKIRRPLGRLIFNMGIAIPGKTVFLIETAPWLRVPTQPVDENPHCHDKEYISFPLCLRRPIHEHRLMFHHVQENTNMTMAMCIIWMDTGRSKPVSYWCVRTITKTNERKQRRKNYTAHKMLKSAGYTEKFGLSIKLIVIYYFRLMMMNIAFLNPCLPGLS